MNIPYATASSGDKALADMQKALAKFSCQSFGTMIDTDSGEIVVQFRWNGRMVSLRGSWRGYAALLMKHEGRRPRGTLQQRQEKALAQARVSICSVMRDWVKAQITAVECGTMTFEAAFFSHMLLPSGERVIDHLQAKKLLPVFAPEETK